MQMFACECIFGLPFNHPVTSIGHEWPWICCLKSLSRAHALGQSDMESKDDCYVFQGMKEYVLFVTVVR